VRRKAAAPQPNAAPQARCTGAGEVTGSASAATVWRANAGLATTGTSASARMTMVPRPKRQCACGVPDRRQAIGAPGVAPRAYGLRHGRQQRRGGGAPGAPQQRRARSEGARHARRRCQGRLRGAPLQPPPWRSAARPASEQRPSRPHPSAPPQLAPPASAIPRFTAFFFGGVAFFFESWPAASTPAQRPSRGVEGGAPKRTEADRKAFLFGWVARRCLVIAAGRGGLVSFVGTRRASWQANDRRSSVEGEGGGGGGVGP